MNPLLMGALAYAPQIAQGVGNFVGGVARGAGNAQSAMLLNTPAANGATMGEDFANRSWQNFGPNSQRGLEMQQMSDRQMGQRFNYDNKALNEAMKRSYGADSYKNAMEMGSGAINQYLQNSASAMNNVGNLLATRF
jgi:hypothetical protein